MWSCLVPKGAWVAVKKAEGGTEVILASLPNGWSRTKEKLGVEKIL